MANRVITLLGSYNLTTPGTGTYRGKISLMLAGLLAQLSFACTQVYVEVDEINGSDTGGGGTGTSVTTPYRVRNCADWATLWAAIKTTNMEVLFKRGQILRPSVAGGGQGFTTGLANVKLGTYGSVNDPNFEFTGFLNVLKLTVATPFATSDSLKYTITLTTPPVLRWVRIGANLAEQLERVYMRVASTAGMPARSWNYNSGTGVLTIRRDDAQTDDVLNQTEVAIGTGVGITLTNHDLNIIRGITSTGWGMESDTSSNYCILSQAQGNNLHLIDGSWAYWGPQHVMGALASGAGNTGGCVMVRNCKFGLGISGASGMTNYVHYAHTGDQESIMLNCVSTHGGLKTNVYSTEYNGEPWYYHTSADTLAIAFIFRQNCTALNRTTNNHGQIYNWDCLPAVTDQANLSQYAAWVEGETIDWTLGDIDGFFAFGGSSKKYGQFYRCNYRFVSPVPAGANRLMCSAACNGQFRRCRFQFVTLWNGKTCTIFGAVAGAADFIACSIENTKTTGASTTFFTGGSTNIRAFRCVFQSAGSVFEPNITNGAPGTSAPYTSGYSDCAFYNVVGTLFNSSTRPITLTAAISFDQRADIARLPDAIRAISTGWPETEAAQEDIYNHKPRYAARSSLGPLEDSRNWRKRDWRYAVA